MKKRLLLLFSASLLCLSPLFSQDKSKIKFGNVKPEDFSPAGYAIDSSATAVVLADIGSTEIIGNNKGTFSLVFRNFRRARIISKNGYDIANVEIPLYTNGSSEEEIEQLKAVTYNLENGKVIETKLEIKSAVFKDQLSKNTVVRKFTFPNIREGSIIEYEYRVKSDFIFNLQPWEFQGQYPRLWSEYNVAMPEFYNYVTLTQGYHTYHVNEQKVRQGTYNMVDNRGTGSSDRTSFACNITDYRWVMKDVPALKEESFTSTLNNHISRISFQLASQRDPFPYRMIMSNWEGVAKDLLDDEDFGAQLKKDNGWLNDVMKEVIKKDMHPIEKAKTIYAWVRDNFTCTNYSRVYLNQSLRNVLKSRNGSEAEINLLLIAMLRKAGLEADPILLSTRSHGYTHSIYPLMDRFNYVIAAFHTGDISYYLDASEPRMGFGRLDYKCYNGHARIINASATAIEMNADVLQEAERTTVFIINDEKGNSVGSVQRFPGYFESRRIRGQVKEKGREQYLKDIKKGTGTEIEISNARIDSLDNYDETIGIFYDFDIVSEKEDIIYFNPMFGEGYRENPFKSARRFYPVEMPFTIDQTFNLQMDIPRGYVLDELPQQVVVKLNEEGDAVFEYRVSESNGTISLRSRVIVKRSFFVPEEYETLREFFNLIVKKHNEQFVFKKKK